MDTKVDQDYREVMEALAALAEPVREEVEKLAMQIGEFAYPVLSTLAECATAVGNVKIPKKWEYYATHAKKSRTRKKYFGKIQKRQVAAFVEYLRGRT